MYMERHLLTNIRHLQGQMILIATFDKGMLNSTGFEQQLGSSPAQSPLVLTSEAAKLQHVT